MKTYFPHTLIIRKTNAILLLNDDEKEIPPLQQITTYSTSRRLLKSEKKTQITLDQDKAAQSFPSAEKDPKLGN